MHGGAGGLPTGIQAGHDLILAIHMPEDLWKEDFRLQEPSLHSPPSQDGGVCLQARRRDGR